MKALVTGGAGFIGSNLVDALLAAGHDVTVLDNLSSGRRENLDGAIESGASLVEADVTDRDAVEAAFSASTPDVVLHLAAQIDVRRSVEDPRFDLNVNVGGTIVLLDACVKHGAKKLVMASTGGAIYGEGAHRELPLNEDAERLPDAPYGQSKLAAEGYLSLFGRLHGFRSVALRLGNVYGPRQDPLGEAGVVSIFGERLLGGGTPKVFGDGLQTRDYVFVGDVVAAFIAAAESPDAQGAYNIGTGVETSVLTLGKKMGDACGTGFDPEMAPPRPGEVQRISIDPARARSALSWKSGVELDSGLQQTIDWLRTQ